MNFDFLILNFYFFNFANTQSTIMTTLWKEYQDKNEQRFLDEMLELLRIPSVSAKTEHKDDMRKCAELVKKRLLD